MRLESLILNIILKDPDFAKKVHTHIKPEYFGNKAEKVTLELILEHMGSYKKAPTHDILKIKLTELVGLSESEFVDTKKVMESAVKDRYEYDLQWMVDETEKFCREKAIYNGIMKSVRIINGEEPKMSDGMIPTILQQALAVAFDKRVGHDYFEEVEQRYEYYHSSVSRIPCSIDIMNRIMNGGPARKTLGMFLGPTGSGKSAVFCSLACDYVIAGYNVLYITLELAEEKVGERLDANLLGTQIKDISHIQKEIFVDRLSEIKSKTMGRLMIKEYPTKSASATDFGALMDELKTKKDFSPDILIVDYLGITASARLRNTANVNSYTYQQSVSEELRALAMERDILVLSAVQTNRTAFGASDFDLDSISDSAGIAHTADFILGIIRTEELNELGQCMLKQLKNRFGDLDYYRRFIVGFDTSRMKMYNVNDQSSIGKNDMQEKPSAPDTRKDRYEQFKADTRTATDFDFG